MPKLLIVDDEPNLLYSLEKSMKSDTLQVLTAGTAKQGIEQVEKERPDVVILDVRLPDMSGLDAFKRLRQIDPQLPVILITAFATTDAAIEAMKCGAFDYLLKPLDLFNLRKIVARGIEASRLSHVPAVFEQEDHADRTVDTIVGRSAAMQAMYKEIGLVAGQDVTVLISGESGTGKELVARAIYHHSGRCHAPFLVINCPAIPEGLLESELFGHERGAFTGAVRQRIGKFEQARGGTVFLDEIGDMDISIQAKLLRLLQEQRFERVGGNETIQTDVRILAVTNQNLEKLVAVGRFRQDLYFRLKVISIRLPPLRERLDDLPLLVEHFLHLYNPQLRKQVQQVPPETITMLAKHDWPGNIRELQSVIKHALLHATGDTLTQDCVLDSLQNTAQRDMAVSRSGTLDLGNLLRSLLQAKEPDIYRKVCQEVDRLILNEVLQHVQGNQVLASEILGISRTTLRAKIQALKDSW